MSKQRYLLFLALLLCVLSMANALSYRMGTDAYSPDQQPPQDSIIYLLHSDVLSFDQKKNPDAQLLKGNVVSSMLTVPTTYKFSGRITFPYFSSAPLSEP